MFVEQLRGAGMSMSINIAEAQDLIPKKNFINI